MTKLTAPGMYYISRISQLSRQSLRSVDVKILNFGSLNFDHVYQVDKMVQEGETVSADRYCRHFGGKGLNQSIAIARAGAQVYQAGAIGQDGRDLVDYLKSCGVDTGYISILEEASGHALIQVDNQGQNGIIVFSGANGLISEDMIDRVLEHFSPGDYITLQNETSNIPVLLRKAYEKEMVIFFNPSPIPEDLKQIPFELVDYLFINKSEGATLSGEKDLDKILAVLMNKYPNCSIILTLGSRGVCYVDKENIYTHGIYDMPVVDTTGAGDTFCGFFIACMSRGVPIPKALETASKASSICISREGAAPSIPTIQEVESWDLIPVKNRVETVRRLAKAENE